MPVTEWARSGPIQSQVTFSPRSIWTVGLDQAKFEIETRVFEAPATGAAHSSVATAATRAAAQRAGFS
jgi:hypothetical protein